MLISNSLAKHEFFQCSSIWKHCATADKVGKRFKQPAATTQIGIATTAGLYVKEVKLDTCIFCQEQYESAHCEKVKQMQLNVRQDIAKEKRACFACLKLNHSYQKCRSKIKCQ